MVMKSPERLPAPMRPPKMSTSDDEDAGNSQTVPRSLSSNHVLHTLDILRGYVANINVKRATAANFHSFEACLPIDMKKRILGDR